MEIHLYGLPHDLNEWSVTRYFATSFVHNREHNPIAEGQRETNFKVALNESQVGGYINDGTGILTLPTRQLGRAFLDLINKQRRAKAPLKINGSSVKVSKVGHPPKYLEETLAKTPYIDPSIEEERESILREVDVDFRVDEIQIGTYYRSKYPQKPNEKMTPRSFSIEWRESFHDRSAALLRADYDLKRFRIILGDTTTEYEGRTIILSFSNIKKIGVGYDGKPYLCFDTHTPCTLEGFQFHRTTYGTRDDYKKHKQRISELHAGHGAVSNFAHQLRVVLYHDTVSPDIIREFVKLCKTAGLSENQILRCGNNIIDASGREFFSHKKIRSIWLWIKKEEWSIAFQIEALLRCGLFNTEDLDNIKPLITTAKKARGVAYCGALLAKYIQVLRANNLKKSPVLVLQDLYTRFKPLNLDPNQTQVPCYHVTFTPSRMILEGPIPTQSNRVLRQYYDAIEHFIRVDFRDEDRLQYRWDKAVDGATFVRDRVGNILKNGFELAGRRFEFLAYSNSALREHAVWFIHPFTRADGTLVNGNFVRDSIGRFEGSVLLTQPSKYAARLGQAFTATDHWVVVKRSEWTDVDVPDLGAEPYLHTDGCGTISSSLRDRIWNVILKARPVLADDEPPTVIQIRFRGFKGVVSVDPLMEETYPGIHMRLRPSMKKFDTMDNDEDKLEVAAAFHSFNTAYLNRPLIMVLEDLGVPASSFQTLQDRAIRDVRTIDDSSNRFRHVLYTHGLGTKFRISHTLEKLESLGGDIHRSARERCYDNPFLKAVRNAAKATVLREIKHNARIPIVSDESHNVHLIGFADEGPAYARHGKDVYCLPSGKIFACVQKSKKDPPIFLEGLCTVSRSPVTGPGDVQLVYAIGEPPKDKLCLFSHIRNAVVFSSLGDERSLASKLGGGDVDGDTFMVVKESTLLFSLIEQPATYSSRSPKTIEGRTVDVDDICDFIVEYINSDVLGLLSDRLLIIADQSEEGTKDKACKKLAELCSQAVDYPKHGNPIDLDADELPKTLIRCKPDWHAAEVLSPRKLDYYESSRALGKLFRDRNLDFPDEFVAEGVYPPVFPNPITELLRESVEPLIQHVADAADTTFINTLFVKYCHELTYICTVNTLTNAPGVSLLEVEVVVGTILAKCSQRRLRNTRIQHMKLHVEMLAQTVLREVQGRDRIYGADREQVLLALKRGWELWLFTTHNTDKFGANSLGLLALRIVCSCLEQLEQLVLGCRGA